MQFSIENSGSESCKKTTIYTVYRSKISDFRQTHKMINCRKEPIQAVMHLYACITEKNTNILAGN